MGIVATYKVNTNNDVTQHHPDYDSQLKIWKYIDDLYFGVDQWLELKTNGFQPTDKANLYLPRHVAESFENWVSRINASYYDDLFAKALRQFVDLSFSNGVYFTGDSDFREHYKDIDLHGSHGDVFLRQFALSVMKYGHSFLLIDFPHVQFDNYADFIESGARPYWVEINPKNLINWRCRYAGDSLQFTLAVIKEEVLAYSGNFGYESVNQYRVLRPGSWEVWRELGGDQDKKLAMVEAGNYGISYVPIVPVFAGNRLGECVSVPPLRSLAEKNRILYQMTSDHNRKVSLCCQPVPVLKDSMRGDEPLEIGPNSFISLRDPSGSFQWVEPLALSLEQSRKDLDDLRQSISQDAASYLTSPTDRQSSRTTELLTIPLQSNLSSFIASFCDGVNRAIKIHHQYLGITEDATISLDATIFEQKKDSQLAYAIQGLFRDGILTRKTALEAIQNLGILAPNFNLDEELKSNG